TESLVLAAIGGTAGFALAQLGVRAMLTLAPDALPRMSEVTVDSRTLLVSSIFSLLSGILFGLVTAFRGSGGGIGMGLKSTTGSGQPAARHRLLAILVVAEFSLAVILLTGAGLLARSFERLLSATPGFSPQHLITVQLALPDARYPQGSQIFIVNSLSDLRPFPASSRPEFPCRFRPISSHYKTRFERRLSPLFPAR